MKPALQTCMHKWCEVLIHISQKETFYGGCCTKKLPVFDYMICNLSYMLQASVGVSQRNSTQGVDRLIKTHLLLHWLQLRWRLLLWQHVSVAEYLPVTPVNVPTGH